MSFLLTEKGVAAAKIFISDCEAFRKSIIDAGIDTADETELPSIGDIEDDINFTELDDTTGDYYNCWGVTDNYNSEVISLRPGIDFIDSDTLGKKLSLELDRLIGSINKDSVCSDYDDLLLWIEIPEEFNRAVYRFVGYDYDEIDSIARRFECCWYEICYHCDSEDIVCRVLGGDSNEVIKISDYAKSRLRPIFKQCVSA